ncbi:MAG TPA: hypothetical protein PKC45_11340, partial [Gemmatales bacterium]|nr:hypothetical protein [Gemmatales bacterium]
MHRLGTGRERTPGNRAPVQPIRPAQTAPRGAWYPKGRSRAARPRLPTIVSTSILRSNLMKPKARHQVRLQVELLEERLNP